MSSIEVLSVVVTQAGSFLNVLRSNKSSFDRYSRCVHHVVFITMNLWYAGRTELLNYPYNTPFSEHKVLPITHPFLNLDQSDLVNNEQDQDTNEAADTQLKRTNRKHEWTHCISYFGLCCAYTTYNQYHRR
eukprot:686246_1